MLFAHVCSQFGGPWTGRPIQYFIKILFSLNDKQELISKVYVCQTKVNKSQNLNNIYEKTREILNQLAKHFFKNCLKEKGGCIIVMLVIVGITIICLAVARSLNYIGDNCVIVNEDIHEKIK